MDKKRVHFFSCFLFKRILLLNFTIILEMLSDIQCLTHVRLFKILRFVLSIYFVISLYKPNKYIYKPKQNKLYIRICVRKYQDIFKM